MVCGAVPGPNGGYVLVRQTNHLVRIGVKAVGKAKKKG